MTGFFQHFQNSKSKIVRHTIVVGVVLILFLSTLVIVSQSGNYCQGVSVGNICLAQKSWVEWMEPERSSESLEIVDKNGKTILTEEDILNFDPMNRTFEFTNQPEELKIAALPISVRLNQQEIFKITSRYPNCQVGTEWFAPIVKGCMSPVSFRAGDIDPAASDFMFSTSAEEFANYAKHEFELIRYFWSQKKLSKEWQLDCHGKCEEGKNTSFGKQIYLNSDDISNRLMTVQGHWIATTEIGGLRPTLQGYKQTAPLSESKIIYTEILLNRLSSCKNFPDSPDCAQTTDFNVEKITLADYFRQYIGFEKQNGHNIVYINLINKCNIQGYDQNCVGDRSLMFDDTSKPIIVKDGGTNFIDVEVDLTDKRVTLFSVHGKA